MLQIKKGKLVYELEYFADSNEWEVKSPKGLYEIYLDENLLEFLRGLEQEEIAPQAAVAS